MRNSKLLISTLTLGFLLSAPVNAEETNVLPVITLADIANIIEDRCPCADIPESSEEEDREDRSPLDEIEDLTDNRCNSEIANPGKYKQGLRFLINLGIVQLEEGESLKSVFANFKEVRKDCRGNSKGNSNNGNSNN